MKNKTLDILLSLVLYPSAFVMKKVRAHGIKKLPRCQNILNRVGVFPIQDHFYEPCFNYEKNKIDFNKDRNLPGINWNVDYQLHFVEEMSKVRGRFDIDKKLSIPNGREFKFQNNAFESGDAEFWYQFIKKVRPQKIIEIGSGYSTLIAAHAIKDLKVDLPDYQCSHRCIEPFERPWLESLGIEVIRDRAESIDLNFFQQLNDGDVLFIDSSHIIRPNGDVLFEYLEILPVLAEGVYVHIHDIFSPREYLKEWIVNDVRFWNEQYLLEAFLSHNMDWDIVAAVNWLKNNHYTLLKDLCPYLDAGREPGSFYIQRKKSK